jgi:hypothetical protein
MRVTRLSGSGLSGSDLVSGKSDIVALFSEGANLGTDFPSAPIFYPMHISKIVSGGQTGADRGGWEAAIYCSLPYGGWIPLGRKSEDGIIPARYKSLQETGSSDYLARTEANVVDSDATLVFTYGPPTGGSKRTVELAQKHRRPCLGVDLNEPRIQTAQKIVDWLKGISVPAGVLNVAGSRASKSPGIDLAVTARMVDVISQINGRLFYPIQG